MGNGSWNMAEAQSHSPPPPLTSWICLNFDPMGNTTDLTAAAGTAMMGAMQRMGMTVQYPCQCDGMRPNEAIEDALARIMQQYPTVQMLLCLLPDNGKDESHARIKLVMDCNIGIVTQCILS